MSQETKTAKVTLEQLPKEIQDKLLALQKKFGVSMGQVITWVLCDALALCLFFISSPAMAADVELREAPASAKSKGAFVVIEQETFKDRHPVIYFVGSPVRWTWNAAVWTGKKAEPICPFLNVCGSLGAAAQPFAYGFFGKRN